MSMDRLSFLDGKIIDMETSIRDRDNREGIDTHGWNIPGRLEGAGGCPGHPVFQSAYNDGPFPGSNS